MNKVVSIATSANADILICYATMPPMIIPVTEQAKRILPLGEADAALFLDDDAEDVLALFGDDMIVAMREEYRPKLIVTMSIKQLH